MENHDQTPPPGPGRSGALGSPLVPQEYDEEKLKNLILYICEKSKDDPHFDDEKLVALLWEIDKRAYVLTGKSITGATYIKATLADLKREPSLSAEQPACASGLPTQPGTYYAYYRGRSDDISKIEVVQTSKGLLARFADGPYPYSPVSKFWAWTVWQRI